MKDVKKCEDCGHSMREHLRDFNGRVNCQVCERKGLVIEKIFHKKDSQFYRQILTDLMEIKIG